MSMLPRHHWIGLLVLGFIVMGAAVPGWGQTPDKSSLPPSRRTMNNRTIEEMPSSRRDAVLGESYRTQGAPVPQRRIVGPAFSKWQLGVNTEDAPMGLMIKNVQTWTPAYSAGLEVGDYIVDVNGYPVGFYPGGYFPLQTAFGMLADPNGWVELGIWNKRTKREEYMWVMLTRR